MKLLHIKDFVVTRHYTIAETLVKGSGEHPSADLFARFLDKLHLNKTTEADLELKRLLHEPLWREYEGEQVYQRTGALVVLDRRWSVPEYDAALAEKGFYPASISEGVSYLADSKTEVNSVFHLRTFLQGNGGTEYRLLTKSDGSAELIPFYRPTCIKQYYTLVAIKEKK